MTLSLLVIRVGVWRLALTLIIGSFLMREYRAPWGVIPVHLASFRDETRDGAGLGINWVLIAFPPIR